MSLSISSSSLFVSDYSLNLPNSEGQAASTTATAAVPGTSTSGAASSTFSSATSANPLVQDMTSLLQALATGNVSAAQTDVAKVKADLKAQESASTSSDSSAVHKGNGHHHHEAAEASSDSSSSSDSISASSSTSSSGSPLDALLTQISSALGSGTTGGALQDLAGFLVQNGEGSGNLVDASA